MLQDYWRNQQSSRLSVGQKKHLAGLPTTLDDYNTYDNKDYASHSQRAKTAKPKNSKLPLSPTKVPSPRGRGLG